MLSRLASLSRPENSALQKSSVIIIFFFLSRYSPKGNSAYNDKNAAAAEGNRSHPAAYHLASGLCLRHVPPATAWRHLPAVQSSDHVHSLCWPHGKMCSLRQDHTGHRRPPLPGKLNGAALKPEEVTRTCNVVCNRCSETSSFKSDVKFKQRVPVRENTKGTVSEKTY